MTPIAITFLVNVATELAKKYILPRFGVTGLHIIIFGFSMIAALYFTYGDQFPDLKNLLLVAIQIFCLAIALYEVVLGKLASLFGGKEAA